MNTWPTMPRSLQPRVNGCALKSFIAYEATVLSNWNTSIGGHSPQSKDNSVQASTPYRGDYPSVCYRRRRSITWNCLVAPPFGPAWFIA